MSLQSIRADLERLRSEIQGGEEEYEIIAWQVHPDGTFESDGVTGPTGRLTADEVDNYIRDRKAAGVSVWSIEIETIDVGDDGRGNEPTEHP